MEAAYLAGVRDFGENYVDELSAKVADVAGEPWASDVVWHYLGALQSRKIATVSALAQVISGVSREKELERLAAQPVHPLLDIQVDCTGLAQRNGARPDEVAKFVADARTLGLPVRGLMTVAPPDPAGAARTFALVRDLAETEGLAELSMGMSDDWPLALAHGATEIRIGRALFGART